MSVHLYGVMFEETQLYKVDLQKLVRKRNLFLVREHYGEGGKGHK